MKCENCKEEIVSCGVCEEHFVTGQTIECGKIMVKGSGIWRRHLHFVCGASVVRSRVIE